MSLSSFIIPSNIELRLTTGSALRLCATLFGLYKIRAHYKLFTIFGGM